MLVPDIEVGRVALINYVTTNFPRYPIYLYYYVLRQKNGCQKVYRVIYEFLPCAQFTLYACTFRDVMWVVRARTA